MARDHARVNLTIWTDPDFRALPPAAQHLYLTLWTAPELSYCGVHDWRPARMTGLSQGFTAEHIETVAACLEARHFFVIDRDTEECLIRSWARFDGIMKQPRMAVSLVSAYASTGSQTIRRVLVREMHKIREESPGLTCWGDKRVAEVLEHPSVSAKDLPAVTDPFRDGVTPDLGPGLALGLPQTQGGVWGSVCTPSTPAPAPAPNSLTTERADKPPAARKRASALPDDFQPNDANRRVANECRVNLAAILPQFLDHHRAKGSTFKDWHAALNTWIRREKPSAAEPARLPLAHDLELPPDGLSDEEYATWQAEQRRRRA